MIQDEAIVCRYCGRDLPQHPGKVANIASVSATWHKPTRDLDTQPLTLEELATLFKLAKHSYPKTPEKLQPTMTKMVQEIVKVEINPLLTKLLVAKQIANTTQLEQEMESLYSIAVAWWICCFTLGVEHGYGVASLQEATRYPFVISQPFCLYVATYLHKLTELRKIGEAESVRETQRIGAKIVKGSIQLAKIGMDEYRTVIPAFTSKESEFITALRQYPFIHGNT